MKYLVIVGLLGLVVMTGCVMPTGSPVSAGIYTDVTGPSAVGPATGFSKVGQSEAMGILVFASGDASIEAAAKAGGISKIHHVDVHYFGILGVYAKATTTVYGE